MPLGVLAGAVIVEASKPSKPSDLRGGELRKKQRSKDVERHRPGQSVVGVFSQAEACDTLSKGTAEEESDEVRTSHFRQNFGLGENGLLLGHGPEKLSGS